MKFNALRDFLAVAERGSLRGAARNGGGAQAALSHSIKALEKELGIALFERGRTGVALTPLGEVFQRRARAVLEEVRRARDELDQLRGKVHGRVSIAMSSVPHLALYPAALRPFRQRFPDVRIDLVESVYPTIESRLLDGSLDFYAGAVPDEVSAGLTVEKLFDNSRVIVARKGHPLAGARSLAELVDAEWVGSSVTVKTEEELMPLFAQHGLPPPRIAMTSHSTLSFLTSMAYSDLLMILPVQWTQSPLFGSVQQIKVKEHIAAPPIGLVMRAGWPLTPAAEHFCDLLRREAAHCGPA